MWSIVAPSVIRTNIIEYLKKNYKKYKIVLETLLFKVMDCHLKNLVSHLVVFFALLFIFPNTHTHTCTFLDIVYLWAKILVLGIMLCNVKDVRFSL